MAKKKKEKISPIAVKEESCNCHSHGKRAASIMLLVGVLILLNAYFAAVSWPVFIGALVVLKGLKCLLMPCK